MDSDNLKKTCAAVTTAAGSAAISSIELTGACAAEIIKKIFKPLSGADRDLKTGDILLGHILDCGQVIDEVLIGCQAQNSFAINCHGNPLIVQMIMALLKKNGAELISCQQMLTSRFEQSAGTTIAAEAKLAMLKAVTMTGIKLIESQLKTGLSKTLHTWLENIDTISPDDLRVQCRRILARSKTAGLIINGARIVIAGPPNCGKSTLLNCLSGKQKAIVTDIPGTTRDWIGSICRTENLLIEFIDTAGVDTALADPVDEQSQKITARLVADCDLVLFVLDGSEPIAAQATTVPAILKDSKKLLVVFNKSDLNHVIYAEDLSFQFACSMRISAKTGDGIDRLIEKIYHTLGIDKFDTTLPVCFTDRQRVLLKRLANATAVPEVKSPITQLLSGPVCV